MKMKTLTAILALASPFAALAEERTVEASFYCFKYAPGAETIQVTDGQNAKALRLSTANIIGAVPLKVTNDEAVIQGIDNAAAAARVKIPKRFNKALVVLVPAPSGSAEKYRAFAIDFGRDRFRPGTYRMVNISKKAVRGAIGKSYAEVKSGDTADIELQGDEGATQGVKFEFHEGGKWNRLTETRAAVRRDRRWLVLVHEDPVTQRMNLRSIPDREIRPTPPPVTTAALAE
jgi:hypothetical protein